MADPNAGRVTVWDIPDPVLADALRAHGFEASPPVLDDEPELPAARSVADLLGEAARAWSDSAGAAADGAGPGVGLEGAGDAPSGGDAAPEGAAEAAEHAADGATWWVDPAPDAAAGVIDHRDPGAGRSTAARPISAPSAPVAAAGPTPPPFLAGRIARTAPRPEPTADATAGLADLAAFAAIAPTAGVPEPAAAVEPEPAVEPAPEPEPGPAWVEPEPAPEPEPQAAWVEPGISEPAPEPEPGPAWVEPEPAPVPEPQAAWVEPGISEPVEWAAPEPQAAWPAPGSMVEPGVVADPAASAWPEAAPWTEPSMSDEAAHVEFVGYVDAPPIVPSADPSPVPTRGFEAPRGTIRDIGRRPPGALPTPAVWQAGGAGATAHAATHDTARLPEPDPAVGASLAPVPAGADLWDLVTAPAPPEGQQAVLAAPSRLTTVLLTLLVIAVIVALVLGFLWSFTNLLGS